MVNGRLMPADGAQKPAPKIERGPGTELKNLLGMLRIRATPDCPCMRHVREMDVRGADWCAENIDTIVGWLRIEAQKRGLPFHPIYGKKLVQLAIWRARSRASKPAL